MELSARICGDARIAHDGRLELQGVFNELYTPAFPARQSRLVLVAMLVWDAGERGHLDFRIDLESSEGASVFTVHGHTDVTDRAQPSPPPKTQPVLPLHNVMFPSSGRYRFVFNVLGQRVLRPSLYVQQEAQQNRL